MREIEIHDAREDTRDDHELVVTRGNQSTALGFTTAELCQLYAAIELRLLRPGVLPSPHASRPPGSHC